MTEESKKTKFTVFKFVAAGSGSFYFWINQDTNAKLIDLVKTWGDKYFRGYKWHFSFQTDVIQTRDAIQVMNTIPMNDDVHCCLMDEVSEMPKVPNVVASVQGWVIFTLSNL